MPKISVLIPAYNVEPYLRECIDSVLNQTMQDFEIICIDDASTDGTRNILEDYQKKDSRNHIPSILIGDGQNNEIEHAKDHGQHQEQHNKTVHRTTLEFILFTFHNKCFLEVLPRYIMILF